MLYWTGLNIALFVVILDQYGFTLHSKLKIHHGKSGENPIRPCCYKPIEGESCMEFVTPIWNTQSGLFLIPIILINFRFFVYIIIDTCRISYKAYFYLGLLIQDYAVICSYLYILGLVSFVKLANIFLQS